MSLPIFQHKNIANSCNRTKRDKPQFRKIFYPSSQKSVHFYSAGGSSCSPAGASSAGACSSSAGASSAACSVSPPSAVCSAGASACSSWPSPSAAASVAGAASINAIYEWISMYDWWHLTMRYSSIKFMTIWSKWTVKRYRIINKWGPRQLHLLTFEYAKMSMFTDIYTCRHVLHNFLQLNIVASIPNTIKVLL